MTVGRQQAEQARLRVLGGPDTGVVFVLTTGRVTIGRGEENDIILTDLKTSRKHAEVTIGPAGAVLRDLGSAHGIMVNGKPVKQGPLRSGDRVGLGETVLEFILADTGATRLMVVPPPQSAPVVGTGTSGLTQFIPRPQAPAKPTASAGAYAKLNVAPAKAPSFIEKNKKLVVALGVLMALAVMIPEVDKKNKKKHGAYSDPPMIDALKAAGLGPPPVDPVMLKQADLHFKECYREFRANNYLRAQAACEVALQVYGDHALARVYLESTAKKMLEEANKFLEVAKKDEDAGRYRAALEKCEAVKRMYAKDQSNLIYKQADTQAIAVEKKMKEMDR